jgi:hypothetical protein
VENAPQVEIVVLLPGPKNNEETGSSRSLLQRFVAASFTQHHASLSLRAPACRGVAISFELSFVTLVVVNSLPPFSPHTLLSASHCWSVIPTADFINAPSYILSLFFAYRNWQRLR